MARAVQMPDDKGPGGNRLRSMALTSVQGKVNLYMFESKYRAATRALSCAWLLAAGVSACSAPVNTTLLDDADPEISGGSASEPASLEQAVLEGTLDQTPTTWSWHHGRTAAQVDELIRVNGARIVSLHVESAAPSRFTVALVRNSGRHAATSRWIHDFTALDLQRLVAAGTERMVDIDAYEVDGSTRFAAVLVPNTGSNQKAWAWAHGRTREQVSALVDQNDVRLTDLHEYTSNGATRYAVLTVRNTGADNKSWWVYYGRTRAQIDSLLAQHRAVLTTIQQTSDGRYNALMELNPGVTWWWNWERTPEQITAYAAQTGSRIVDIKSHVVNGSRRFVGVFLNNSNAESTRIGNLLRGGTNGSSGFVVKRVGSSSVDASLQPDFAFDPASAIKTLIGIHAMAQIQPSGGLELTSTINTHKPPSLLWCPSAEVTGTETFDNALREMLVNSDNQRTRAFLQRFGTDAIHETARDMGMTSANIVSFPGCLPFNNRWTLSDAVRMYEALANATIVDTTRRDQLLARMPGPGQDSDGVIAAAQAMIDSEGTSLGLSASRLTRFKDRFTAHYKSGHHWFFSHNLSIAGIANVPVCSGTTIGSQQYVWGLFVNGESSAAGTTTFNTARVEPLRAAIRSSLTKWATCTP